MDDSNLFVVLIGVLVPSHLIWISMCSLKPPRSYTERNQNLHLPDLTFRKIQILLERYIPAQVLPESSRPYMNRCEKSSILLLKHATT